MRYQWNFHTDFYVFFHPRQFHAWVRASLSGSSTTLQPKQKESNISDDLEHGNLDQNKNSARVIFLKKPIIFSSTYHFQILFVF
jgi:hypothetical protein